MAADEDILMEPAARGLTLAGTPLPIFAEPIREPLGPAPLRRPGSVRRTMSIDVTWPDGPEGAGRFLGRCRDLLTPADGSEPRVLAEAETVVEAFQRQVRTITANPPPVHLQDLVGARAGGHLRVGLARVMPEERAAAAPLYLLLDDLAGATLVSSWAFWHWLPDWTAQKNAASPMVMEGVCMGFRPGGGALTEAGTSQPSYNYCHVGPLPNPADPGGWHDLPDFTGMTFRRARRIDVWREGEEICVETQFQDSASLPEDGGRLAIHEYLLRARIDAAGLIAALEASPGTLPHASCRSAPANTEVLLGAHVGELRELVLEKLKRTAGCTHLNDTLRSLAETEALAARL